MSDEFKLLLRLLEEEGPKLHALLARVTLRADVAEDLLQELFLKLREANGFRRADNPTAYAFRTAVHLAFDWRRTRRPTEALTTEPLVQAESPLDGLVAAEELDDVLDAVEALPGLSREVVIMRFLEQQEYPEIAKVLGKTEHQARALCAKALRQLRNAFRPNARDLGS